LEAVPPSSTWGSAMPWWQEKTVFETLLFPPMNRISIDVAEIYPPPLHFLRFPEHCVRLSIIHILGFITPKFLPLCLRIMAALAIFQAWI
jgi:hypothetical protein